MAGNLGDLLKQAGLAPAEAVAPTAPAEAPAPTEDTIAFGPKVVVRFSKKGRGGKAVTLVSGVRIGHDAILGQLRKQLGAGARRDGDVLVVQGNQVERVARWLESQGASRVIRG